MSSNNQPTSNQVDESDWIFQGFLNPTTTPVPDEFFDFLAPLLKEAELRVALYIIRRTFGFKKVHDDISLRQMVEGITTQPRDGVPARVLDRGTGLSKPAVIKAVKSLVRRGVVIATSNQSPQRGFEATTYRLNVLQAAFDGSPLLTKFTRGSKPRQQALVNEVDIQETELQETVKQQTGTSFEHSNIRMAQPEKGRVGIPEEKSTHRGRAASKSFATPGDVLAQRASSPYSPGVIAPKGRGDEPVGERGGKPPGRLAGKPRPETETEEWQVIQSHVADFMRQLGDRAPLKSSTTRAYNLFLASGTNLGTFINKMFEARSRTQELSGNIEQEGDDPTLKVKRKTKAAYFFAVLEDVLHLIDEEERARREAGTGKRRGRLPKTAADTPPQSKGSGERDSEGPFGAFIEH